MPAYFVAIREETTDQAELDRYFEEAPKARAGHHLKALARYGDFRMTEGEPIEGAVIIEFPTFAEAEAWYDSPAYQEAVQHRFLGGKYRTFIIEGVG
ncbi:MAG: DUF1330 domain-containing protein [Thermomicrobiales bacterium]